MAIRAKRPRDLNAWAKRSVDIATGEDQPGSAKSSTPFAPKRAGDQQPRSDSNPKGRRSG
jgi:hypothetical protein